MKILVTGSAGFVSRNLMAALQNLQTGKDKTRPGLVIEDVFCFDTDTDPALLAAYCRQADFVFHFAGVNWQQPTQAAAQDPYGFTSHLLDTLQACGNTCPVMFSSSVQATLTGRYEGSEYGKNKQAGEDLLFEHARRTGAKVLVYRFPNLFGKWCQPYQHSVVATFCHHIARDLPITITDPDISLELVYIDDLVDEMLDALEDREHHCNFNGTETVWQPDGRYCAVPGAFHVTLGTIVELLYTFRNQPRTLVMPEMPAGSFAKKLYATYLSYLPEEMVRFPLPTHEDARGSFTELLRTGSCGQVSVNICRPGVTKEQHWHHTKWELFVVVSGHGLIQERRIGSDEVLRFEVSGDKLEAVHILPGYTHNLINLSDTEDLVTVLWASEPFDPQHPDTFSEPV
ncbi:MAG: NAD-dependent epimerase/dehydratase family protein [Clostridia bacterium]|nr:NAD-dependent epimerase/dehydratase family protein [Clostridia bacterium]